MITLAKPNMSSKAGVYLNEWSSSELRFPKTITFKSNLGVFPSFSICFSCPRLSNKSDSNYVAHLYKMNGQSRRLHNVSIYKVHFNCNIFISNANKVYQMHNKNNHYFITM